MQKSQALPGDSDLFQILLLVFCVVSLATTEFIKSAFPSWDALRPSMTIVVYTIFLVQVIPTLAIVGIDRYIASRDTTVSGWWRRNFRRALFAAGFVLILRQIQLYWDPATKFTNDIRDVSLVLLVLFYLVVLAGVGLVVWRGFRGVTQFFFYMSPIAIAATAIIPFQVQTDEDEVPNYAVEVTTVEDVEGKPPVFLVIFDGLGYDVLLDDDGTIDQERFPNIAELAGEGVWFTDATANYFWSQQSIPTMTDPAMALYDEYSVRLYTHYPVLERRYYQQCGETITCRGVRYITENEPLRVAARLALRTFYQATPDIVDDIISRPMGVFLNRAGWAYPTHDHPGWHTFTKRQHRLFLNEVNGEDAYGRFHILHLLIPHHPMAFDARGRAVPRPRPDGYLQQTMYVDRMMGEVMDKLRSEGIYDDSIVILTSDHGPRTVIPSETQAPALVTPRVPLVIHSPFLEEHGVISDVEYQHYDFEATLADLLGLPPPEDTRGVSAFSEERPDRVKTFFIWGLGFYFDEEAGEWLHLEEQ